MTTAVPSPEIACIVVSHRSQRRTVESVRSLLDQGIPVEVVVVNSGGGGIKAMLAASGVEVPVIDHPQSLYFGAAANLGIAATSAPVVSFLAADCIAEPGWLESRVARHRSGAGVVAGAVTNAYPRNVFAWAAHVLLWSARMPGVPPERALRLGLSYRRSVLEELGGYRGDLRAGEDSEIAARLTGRHEVVWEPGARCAHRNPRGLLSLLADQYRRGSRSVRVWRELGRPDVSRTVATNALRRFPGLLSLAWSAAGSAERRWIILAAPWVPIGAMAYALGAWIGRGRAGSD